MNYYERKEYFDETIILKKSYCMEKQALKTGIRCEFFKS